MNHKYIDNKQGIQFNLAICKSVNSKVWFNFIVFLTKSFIRYDVKAIITLLQQHLTMKSKQQAELKCKNPCNRSTAKFQYSFGKSQRFTRAELTKSINDKFYDLPSELSKRGNIFARSKRQLQKDQVQDGPAPWQYNTKQEKLAKDIGFGLGRQQCKANSVFSNSNVAFPGPDKYNPQKPKTNTHIHIGQKLSRSYSTVSPGPKYSFDTTILDRNKILSNQKRKGSIRIVLPTSKRRVMSQMSEYKTVLAQSMTESALITHKGERCLGKSKTTIVIGKQKRFDSNDKNQDKKPGPGSQQICSDIAKRFQILLVPVNDFRSSKFYFSLKSRTYQLFMQQNPYRKTLKLLTLSKNFSFLIRLNQKIRIFLSFFGRDIFYAVFVEFPTINLTIVVCVNFQEEFIEGFLNHLLIEEAVALELVSYPCFEFPLLEDIAPV